MTQAYYDLGGTVRSAKPSDTLASVEIICRKIGITRVANITGLDGIGVPVVTCIRPQSKHLSVSQGKGLTLDLAKISAIMESIEAYHMENAPSAALQGTYKALNTQYTILDPDRVLKNIYINSLQETSLEWVKAKNIVNGYDCYIPRPLISLDSTMPNGLQNHFLISSNGLASGNCHDEACCHSLYEVVERDALCQWAQQSAQQQTSRKINIDTIVGDFNETLIQKVLSQNLQLIIWDITSTMKIPSYHCCLIDPSPFAKLHTFTGTGTHLSKDIALSRAITEAIQSKLTLISGNRDDVFPDYYTQIKPYIKNANHGNGELDYKDCYQAQYASNFNNNVKQIVKMIRHAGHEEILVFDHTKEDLKIPVTQAIIPGMQFNGRRI